MASPQRENGYTAIANEIAEALARTELNGYESRYLWFLLRKTYGWNKKEDYISLSQFEQGTGIAQKHICRTAKSLLNRNIIYKKGLIIGLQKDYSQWGLPNMGLPKMGLPNLGQGTPKSGNKPLPNLGDTKEIKTINKRHLEMYNYEPIDEAGNPTSKKQISKVDGDTNKMLISVGVMWAEMVKKKLSLEDKDIVLKNIYYPIRATYDREKWSKEDFKKLFEYYLNDQRIKQEDKISFDLCLSQKYVAKYKLAQKQRPKLNSSISSEIKL